MNNRNLNGCAPLLAVLLVGAGLQAFAQSPALEELDKTGTELIKKGDLPAAMEWYQDALKQAREKGDQHWEAEFFRAIGEIHQRQNDFAAALPWYEDSLKIREALHQDSKIAYMLVGTGLANMELGHLKEAKDRLERGRDLNHKLGDRKLEANALTMLVQIANKEHELDKADRLLAEALAIYRELDYPSGLVHCHALGAELLAGKSLYHDALKEAFAAVDLAKTITGLPREDMIDVGKNHAKALEIIGDIYQRTMQPARSLQYYQGALHELAGAGDRLGFASVSTNMGPLLITLRKTAEAEKALTQALDFRRKYGKSDDVGATLMALGELNLSQKKIDEARQKYEDALRIFESGRVSGRAVALYQLGEISLETGDLEHALSYHQRALDLRRPLPSSHDLLRSLNRMAIVRERRNELTKAAELHAEALKGFENLSLEFADPVELAAFRETAARLYPSYARVLFKQGKTGEALLMAERSRGQTLSRTFLAAGSSFLELLTPEERAGWQTAASTLAMKSNRLRELMEQSAPDEERTEAYGAWLDARSALAHMRERLFAANTHLRASPPRVPSDLATLLDLSRRNPRTLYVEWLVDTSETLLFVIASGKEKGYLLPAGSEQIRPLASEWRYSMAVSAHRRGTVVPNRQTIREETECAGDFFRLVFGPFAESIESGEWDHLVAVTDGPLLDVPLAAMQSGKGARLVETYAISTAPSLHSLADKAPERHGASGILLVGDPLEHGQKRTIVPSGETFLSLENARVEAESIAAMSPHAISLIGPKAREAAVKQQLNCCSILHFATHGVLDATDGMNSGLLLAAEPGDSTEDGLLEAREIADMRLNAQLAVLSACDTALGDRRLGEGLMGLAWAFQAAGVPAVVASDWSVDDTATSDLMRVFYTELRKGTRSDEALQRAMLKTREGAERQSPFYWAGFSLIGRPAVVQ